MPTEDEAIVGRPLLRQGGRFLLIAACLVVVIAGMKAARTLLVPILLSAFLAFLCTPAIRVLKGRRLPPWLAISVVIVFLIVALLAMSAMVGSSINEFAGRVNIYDQDLDEIRGKVLDRLHAWGLDPEMDESLQESLDAKRLLTLISSTLLELVNALSNFAVILLITIFMLIEAEGLPSKLRRIGGGADADLSRYLQVGKAVNDFLRVKTLMSILTGVAVAIFLLILGVPFPFLWGVVAFLFNYIPQIGSIIAAIPAVLLALVTKDLTTAIIAAGCYVAMNTVIGNVLEPRMMGKTLGLSIFVTVISLVFWNWVLGPVGMLLSIPLTMVVKILLEHSEDMKAAAILLGPPE